MAKPPPTIEQVQDALRSNRDLTPAENAVFDQWVAQKIEAPSSGGPALVATGQTQDTSESAFTSSGRNEPKPLTPEERAGAVRFRPQTPDRAAREAEVEEAKAQYKIRNDAQNRLRAVQDAVQAKQDRLAEFARYEEAGMPNGPLTVDQRREREQLEVFMRSDVLRKLERARAAMSDRDYDGVHQALK